MLVHKKATLEKLQLEYVQFCPSYVKHAMQNFQSLAEIVQIRKFSVHVPTFA